MEREYFSFNLGRAFFMIAQMVVPLACIHWQQLVCSGAIRFLIRIFSHLLFAVNCCLLLSVAVCGWLQLFGTICSLSMFEAGIVTSVCKPLASRVCEQRLRCVFTATQALVLNNSGKMLCNSERRVGCHVACMRLKPLEGFAGLVPRLGIRPSGPLSKAHPA